MVQCMECITDKRDPYSISASMNLVVDILLSQFTVLLTTVIASSGRLCNNTD